MYELSIILLTESRVEEISSEEQAKLDQLLSDYEDQALKAGFEIYDTNCYEI